jgi:hypothetical protein
MFDNFPKVRQPLPQNFQNIYASHYKLNREGQTAATSVAQKMESWLHRQVARDVGGSQDEHKVTLELGAGTLNQLRYEPFVKHYDVVEPFEALYKASPDRARVRNIYADISNILTLSHYDRITSVATLEHVCNLPEVVAKCGLLLAENGVMRSAIPSEGTFLWTLGWKLTTGLEFRFKYGLDYGILMRHEHVNTAEEIEAVLNYFFEEVGCSVFGLCKSVSFYRHYECRKPRIDRCRAFAARSGKSAEDG